MLDDIEIALMDAKRGDLLLKGGVALETKSWLGWSRISTTLQRRRLRVLESQIATYLRDPKVNRLMLEFEKRVPRQVAQRLMKLQSRYGDQLTWTAIR